MKAETHITVGVTVGAALVASSGATVINKNELIIILITVFAALLPDIDHEASMISRHASLLGLPFRLLGHRGFTHSLAIVVLLYLGLGILDPPPSFLIAFLAGYASHLVADALTHQGIMLFYPLRWRVRLLPKKLSISTGGAREHVFASLVFLCLLLIGVPLVVGR